MQKWVRGISVVLHYLLLRDSSLTIKMLVHSGLLVLVPMLIVAYVSYEQSAKVLEEEAKRSSWQIIEQVKTHLEYYVLDFEISALKIVNHREMQRFMQMQTVEEIEESGIRKAIQQILYDAAYSRRDIAGITVILDNLQIIDTMGVKSNSSAASLTEEYWYQDVPLNGQSMLISRYIQLPDRTEPVISIVRRLISPRTFKPVGMIIIDVNFKKIREIADMVTVGRTGYMSILDAKGHYVFHPKLNLIGERAPFHTLPTLLSETSGSLLVGDKSKELLTFSRSGDLGWTMLTLVPYQEITQGSQNIRQYILWVALIALCIAYPLGFTFASSIIRPIKRLQRFVKKVERGDFSDKVIVESKDEIGVLSQGFNHMVDRLTKLLEEISDAKLKETEANLRQKEMELRILQSQINPHFLYNALETMRGMALEADMDDIAEIGASLSRLLRYNLKESSPTITVQEELEVCRLYLQIQKYRFEERLDYEIDMPVWTLQNKIPKFSLQPIIENCIHHGVDPSLRQTSIRIRAYKESESKYVIEISDSGPGIEPQRLYSILHDLQYRDISMGGSRIGVVNVHRRIEYLFGQGYGLWIDSEQTKGTKVFIRLPLEKWMS